MPEQQPVQRKPAAILTADIAGRWRLYEQLGRNLRRRAAMD